ncbi:hypothetical protein [Paracoccus alcaliphilus]|nr:hypothetical protein [Paracoccus alcaliphilus]WCR19632.1 hypothetical protein JHW40_08310 [Paracoccus alcaliphilus]
MSLRQNRCANSFQACGFAVLAVVVADDELATMPAIRRTLGYYTGAERTTVLLRPADYGRQAIGHFSLFHDSHAQGFWRETLIWLRDGRNPWPHHVTLRVGSRSDGETGSAPERKARCRP